MFILIKFSIFTFLILQLKITINSKNNCCKMIKGKTVLEASVAGFCEKVRRGMVVLKAERVGDKPGDGSEPPRAKELWNVFEVVDGHNKDIYFPTPTEALRPFTYIEQEKKKNIIQDWGYDSCATEDPSDKDLEILPYIEAFELMGKVVALASGVTDSLFPIKFASMSMDGILNAWFQSPASDKAENKWYYDSWMKSSGTPTFKVSGVLIQKAGRDSKAEHRDNYMSFYLKLGQFRYDPNVIARREKRKKAFETGDTAVEIPKKIVCSEEAKRKHKKKSEEEVAKLDA